MHSFTFCFSCRFKYDLSRIDYIHWIHSNCFSFPRSCFLFFRFQIILVRIILNVSKMMMMMMSLVFLFCTLLSHHKKIFFKFVRFWFGIRAKLFPLGSKWKFFVFKMQNRESFIDHITIILKLNLTILQTPNKIQMNTVSRT